MWFGLLIFDMCGALNFFATPPTKLHGRPARLGKSALPELALKFPRGGSFPDGITESDGRIQRRIGAEAFAGVIF
jgi:hypothetical protein